MTKKKDKKTKKERRGAMERMAGQATGAESQAANEKRKAGKGIGKNQLTGLVLDLFRRRQGEVLPLKFIFDELRLKTHPGKALCREILDELIDLGYIVSPEKYRYRLAVAGKELTGTFRRHSAERAVVVADEGGDVVAIAPHHTGGAIDGDTVRVSVSAGRRGAEPAGEVIDIVKRGKNVFVGTLEVNRKYAFLCLDSKLLPTDIYIPHGQLKGGRNGDKAVVEVVQWPARSGQNPLGRVVDVLGRAGNNDTEMHAILAEYGLPYRYPAEVEREAEALHNPLGPQPTADDREELARREDFRSVSTFTIDPDDAKDFDDALSIRALGDGLWEVGVHIADVTYYVHEGDTIDREAAGRATSVYLVDRTIPMLPERLCNFICSLRPDEDKLTYSVVFTMDDSAHVRSSRIVHSIIRSKRRFTYDEAQQVIESGQGDCAPEVTTLNRLAQQLRERRLKAGAIDLGRAEVKFRIDEHGRPLSVYFKEAKEANQLIEEFMLLANRTVAERIGIVPEGRRPKVFPYRIHDLPDPEKLDNLAHFVARFGHKLRTTGTKTEVARAINRLITDVRGRREQGLVETVSLRTMQKARYSTHNIGHYGLGFDHYTHFTSPIRRYPDVMVHRLLTRYIDQHGRSVSQAKYEELCEHCSQQEQLAANAERASVKMKQVEFMAERIGQVFDGTISSVTEWGLYVELNENKCEGMIPIRELGDDYYEFDEKNYCLRGRRGGRVYQLGDAVTVRVARANLQKKQLDFALA